MTVSSYPTIPANNDPPWRSFATRFSRISSFTCRVRSRCSENWLCRSSPSVRGRFMMRKPPEKNNYAAIIRSSRVAISARLLPRFHRAAQVWKERFVVFDEAKHAFGLRPQSQQRLLEIEIEGERSGELKGKLRLVGIGRRGLRSHQCHDLGMKFQRALGFRALLGARLIVEIFHFTLKERSLMID